MPKKRVMPLRKLQKEALAKMKGQTWESSYELGISMNTLNSLYARKLIDRFYGLGSGFFPHTSIVWRLTVAGEEALARIEKEAVKASHD